MIVLIYSALGIVICAILGVTGIIWDSITGYFYDCWRESYLREDFERCYGPNTYNIWLREYNKIDGNNIRSRLQFILDWEKKYKRIDKDV